MIASSSSSTFHNTHAFYSSFFSNNFIVLLSFFPLNRSIKLEAHLIPGTDVDRMQIEKKSNPFLSAFSRLVRFEQLIVNLFFFNLRSFSFASSRDHFSSAFDKDMGSRFFLQKFRVFTISLVRKQKYNTEIYIHRNVGNNSWSR